jgi:hypothetical protein
MTIPARLRRHQTAALVSLQSLAAEYRADGMDEDAEEALLAHDKLAAQVLTSAQRRPQTRRVPLPPVLRVIDGGE